VRPAEASGDEVPEESGAYGEGGGGEGGVGNSAWVEAEGDVPGLGLPAVLAAPALLGVLHAANPAPLVPSPRWSNVRPPVGSGPVAVVAAVVTGMAVVEVRSWSVPGPPPAAAGDPPGSSRSSPSSTYGRIRRGSKSSAAAASAVRVSSRASDARRPHAQDGVPSEARGVEHSGHM
jgi:hypothetical protein